MSPRVRLAPILLGSILAACSSVPPAPTAPERGPHGGVILLIAEVPGLVEIVTEPTMAKPTKSNDYRLAVYFIDPGKTGALTPAPSEVVMDVIWPDSSPRRTIPLTARPAAGDPVGGSKFVSAAGEFDAALSGTLTATIGGKTITLPF
jgi:hypothetical protein